ncbi:hybrid sensor histidine kinase/response regulator [Calothrix sp. 336/3]|uniref:hybrid sensor histidine kinase/response regulator n=1 Tax=Calothrix sp. 336/3 TaxID=1337936 RepID=UPI0004E36C40|nr:ATP-binding protein [Calothrix sp. 336/3]AKG20774.1 hypothetical protein IJ00_05125 [Calothrix sp. 336/3]
MINSSVFKEAKRLEVLHNYQILDTLPEQAFDDLAFLAAQVCRVPISLINLVDRDRQWFKAKVGIDIPEMPRDIGFCPICVENGEILIISDTLSHEQYRQSPVVVGEPYVRFYAGIPIMAVTGEILGTLCVVDQKPRQITTEQLASLQAISRLISKQLEIRRNLAEIVKIKQEYQETATSLQQSESTLRSFFNSSPIMMGVVELKNNDILHLSDNPASAKFFGFTPKTMENRLASEMGILPEYLQQWIQYYLQAEATQSPVHFEYNHTTPQGQKYLRATVASIHGEKTSHPRRFAYIVEDITPQKQLEKQFLRAQRMESIGTLASGIAHDLNNVLSPILMSVQLLKAKCENEGDRQILAIAENNAKRGANLVKQVLSFARGIEGEHTYISVKNLIAEMQQIITQTFPKSITLNAEIPVETAQVCGDSTQLHQVLMNLCLNARDAMPNGGILDLSADNIFIDENYAKMHLDAQAGNYVIITVADNGIGIKNELLDRIFEPFFTTKEFGKGTGLGLSTVMGIIKGHGGFITVKSTLGKGTTFQIFLPTEFRKSIPISEELDTYDGYGKFILVIDDEPAIREITAKSLENYNYQVLTACDGIEAVALYAQYKDKINLAIVDMMMPNMDGTSTITTLHRMNPQLPIVAVSGTSQKLSLEANSAYTVFLPKPYTTHELVKILSRLVGNG